MVILLCCQVFLLFPFTCFLAVILNVYMIELVPKKHQPTPSCFPTLVLVHIVYPDLWVPAWLHKYVCAHITVPDSFTVWSNSPRLTSVRATHRTSATSAGKISALLRTFPYFCWKGSIIVTYLFSLIGLAKKKPPGAGGKGLASNQNLSLVMVKPSILKQGYISVI